MRDKPKVIGSNPITPIYRSVAQLAEHRRINTDPFILNCNLNVLYS